MSWNKFTSAVRRGTFAAILSCCLFFSYGCSIPDLSKSSLPDFDLPLIGDLGNDLVEVSPPELIESLKSKLNVSDPRVSIVEPHSDETFEDDSVSVKLSLSGLKLFKDRDSGLGPHIALILDDQASFDVFDVAQPIHLDDLRPGTHTLRAIAEYPWHESFKEPAAYAQVSFNVLTSSQSNAAGKLPILTTSSVSQTYTAEPMLLDFVVRGAQSTANVTSASQVKVSVNDESFVIDTPDGSVYLSGLKTGQNWLKLELQDAKGHLSTAPFSEQLFAFEFNPAQTSTLGNVLAGKVSVDSVGAMVGMAKPKPPIPPAPVKTSAPSTPVKPAPTSTIPAKPAAPSSISKDIKTEGVAKTQTPALKTVTPLGERVVPSRDLKSPASALPANSGTPARTASPTPGVVPQPSVSRSVTPAPEKRVVTTPNAISKSSAFRGDQNAASTRSVNSAKPALSKSSNVSAAKTDTTTFPNDDAPAPESAAKSSSQVSPQTPPNNNTNQDLVTQMQSLADDSKTKVSQSLQSWRDRLNQISANSSNPETGRPQASTSSEKSSENLKSPQQETNDHAVPAG